MVIQRNSLGQFVKSPFSPHLPQEVKAKISQALKGKHTGKHNSPATEFKARPINISTLQIYFRYRLA